jgi:hypothetical protein
LGEGWGDTFLLLFFSPSLLVFWDFVGWRVASFVKISHPLHTIYPIASISGNKWFKYLKSHPNYSSDYASWVAWLIN